jgi:hypothetical protein
LKISERLGIEEILAVAGNKITYQTNTFPPTASVSHDARPGPRMVKSWSPLEAGLSGRM